MRPLHPLLALCLLCVSVVPASSQSRQPRSDPADVGTGPSSKAPGEMSYEAPKSPATTNARGETTTSSGASAPHSNASKGDAGADRREDSKATKGGPEE
jgi:hypothetical protein